MEDQLEGATLDQLEAMAPDIISQFEDEVKVIAGAVKLSQNDAVEMLTEMLVSYSSSKKTAPKTTAKETSGSSTDTDAAKNALKQFLDAEKGGRNTRTIHHSTKLYAGHDTEQSRGSGRSSEEDLGTEWTARNQGPGEPYGTCDDQRDDPCCERLGKHSKVFRGVEAVLLWLGRHWQFWQTCLFECSGKKTSNLHHRGSSVFVHHLEGSSHREGLEQDKWKDCILPAHDGHSARHGIWTPLVQDSIRSELSSYRWLEAKGLNSSSCAQSLERTFAFALYSSQFIQLLSLNSRRFCQRKHLGTHVARRHGLLCPARLYAHHCTCVSCLRFFHTVPRLQRHLKGSRACMERTCRLLPPLGITEVRSVEMDDIRRVRKLKAGQWEQYIAAPPPLPCHGPHQPTRPELRELLGEDAPLALLSDPGVDPAFLQWVLADISVTTVEPPRCSTTSFWHSRITSTTGKFHRAASRPCAARQLEPSAYSL